MKVTYPDVLDARNVAKKHSLLRCVILFTGADGRIGLASYGKTKAVCESTGKIADELLPEYGRKTYAATFEAMRHASQSAASSSVTRPSENSTDSS